MKLVNLKILALLVISYSLALVAMIPLSWLTPLVEPQLNQAGVRLNQMEGNLWSGQGQIIERQLGTVNVQWDTRASGLFRLALPVDVTLSNTYLDVSGELGLSPFGLSVTDVSGHVDEKAFESVYRSYRATLSGRLQLNGVSADIGWNRRLGDASGDLSWSGGPVTVPVGRSTQTYNVPTLLGTIQSDDRGWKAEVTGPDQAIMLEADLTRDWVATYAVKTALAQAMDIPLPDMGDNLLKRSFEVVY
ncbi:type II secretion system protein N [Reinekea blandensis]|uniref:Type II secretion system protein N n=1 Tax=Reinekea blandensis MED297 TaxID=314283 RepID=A4BER8_9GAMM|nr:type II secretion system protein N [Reinekea blandensis]EAR09495.1 hypothetical protein MED297_02707 [Reinekea sp. MED297] [Reinekea blandensis MED297]